VKDRALVDAVCRDFESAPIDEREKALFRWLAKVNDHPAQVTQDDIDALKAHGWTDEALYEAGTVCAIFNFFNRWIDATGVPKTQEGLFEERLEAHGDHGYEP